VSGSNLFRERLTFEEAFHHATIMEELDQQIDALFREYDSDRSGTIESGTEMDDMIKRLKERGFVFGNRITRDDQSVSAYQPAGLKRVRGKIFEETTATRDTGLEAAEFKDWLRSEVTQRKTNLRVLFATSPWLEEILGVSFEVADDDRDGEVDEKELALFIVKVAAVVGEPPPDQNEIHRIMLIADKSPDGRLTYKEFRYVVIELLARLYYTHFNHSMNGFNLSRSRKSLTSFNDSSEKLSRGTLRGRLGRRGTM